MACSVSRLSSPRDSALSFTASANLVSAAAYCPRLLWNIATLVKSLARVTTLPDSVAKPRTVSAWTTSSEHSFQVLKEPSGKLLASNSIASAANFRSVSCCFNHFRIDSCTSLCMLNVFISALSETNENAFKVPNAFAYWTFEYFGQKERRRDFGISWRSKKLITETRSEANAPAVPSLFMELK